MSLTDEYLLKSLLKETLFYVKHIEENESYDNLSKQTLKKSEMLLAKNIRNTYMKFSSDIIVEFCETAMDVSDGYKIAKRYIKYLF